MPANQDSPSTKTRTLLGALVLCSIVVAGAVVAYLARDFALHGSAMTERVEALGPWGPLGLIGLMIIHCFVPFPAEILAFGAGALYGPVWGTVYIWIGAMLGAALSFGLARWLGRSFVESLLSGTNRARLDRWSSDHGAAALLGMRFLPIIAFNLINYAAGLTRVSWWTFLWTTGLGILPLTALMTYLGHSMTALSWPWLIAAGVACLVGVLLLHKLMRWHDH